MGCIPPVEYAECARRKQDLGTKPGFFFLAANKSISVRRTIRPKTHPAVIVVMLFKLCRPHCTQGPPSVRCSKKSSPPCSIRRYAGLDVRPPYLAKSSRAVEDVKKYPMVHFIRRVIKRQAAGTRRRWRRCVLVFVTPCALWPSKSRYKSRFFSRLRP